MVCINLKLSLHNIFTKLINLDYTPLELKKNIKFDFNNNYYYPVIYFNDFWNFDTEYMPFSDKNKTFNFTFTFSTMSLLQWECILWTKVSSNIR